MLCADLGGDGDVEALARRVTEALNVPITLRGREVFLSASVGVVTASEPRPAADLLRDADVAMYQAKEQGRGRYTLLDDAARAGLSDRLQLSSELRRALERDELRTAYQPLVDLATGQVVAAEALLRWQHPERGTLLPGAFLSLAHEVGAQLAFDRWVLQQACRDAGGWGSLLQRPLGVWVNLSSHSLADPGLPGTVRTALAEADLDPQLLTLEITEGALMRDAASTVRALQALRALGVRLAVDDFGTGYSSLAYLQQFPVHTLKVDRSFVGRLDDGRLDDGRLDDRMAEDDATEGARASGAIVRAVVSLATGLQLSTVAEGIETPGQLSAARALGCGLGQGFFLGRPASASEVLLAATSGVLLPPDLIDVDGPALDLVEADAALDLASRWLPYDDDARSAGVGPAAR